MTVGSLTNTPKYRLGKELGVDPNVILQTSHGRRSIDTLAVYDQNKANWECPYPVSGRQKRAYLPSRPANSDDVV